jgi:hypothetical protein
MHWGTCYISILAAPTGKPTHKQTKEPFYRLAGALKSARKLKIIKLSGVTAARGTTQKPWLVTNQ